MKTTSKWISAIAVVALSGTIAFAQTGTTGNEGRYGHGHHGHKMGMMFAKKLNLTDAQKEQAKALRKSFREENKAFFDQARQTRQEFRAAKQAGDTAKADSLKPTLQAQRDQMKQLRAAQEQKFLQILTPDQRAQYDSLKAQWQTKHQGRRGEK
jgi:Spy/CpxP family protein refolding chaperone